MIIKAEPNALVTNLETVGAALFAVAAVHHHVNNYLTAQNADDVTVPQLAAELPSLDNGTIRLLPDGRMETTWKLRPNVKWHDGTPVTSKDIAFGWRVASDPSWPLRNPVSRIIVGMETPDPQTVVMTWREPSIYASRLERATIDPLPSHKLEAEWSESPETVPQNPYFTDASVFIGTGAFRPVKWDRGSSLVTEAFPDYAFGKPKIDRLTFSFIVDPRTALANLLAGAGDILNYQLGAEEVSVIEEAWKPRNGGTVEVTQLFYRFLFLQHRPDVAKPSDMATDPRVRKAFAYALDREQVVEGIIPGSKGKYVAHAIIPPGTASGDAIDKAITRYTHDPNRALQLLQDAGWSRGADGTLTKGSERFSLEMRNSALIEAERAFALMQQDLRRIGGDIASLDNPSTYVPVDYALYPGILISTTSSTGFGGGFTRYDSRQVATAENRWAGQNPGGYRNPAFDRVSDDYFASIRLSDQDRNLAEGWRLLTEDVATVPLYYYPSSIAVRAGISGFFPTFQQTGYGSNLWEVK
jgi:peptide/nickel transport system substrate-binding protein